MVDRAAADNRSDTSTLELVEQALAGGEVALAALVNRLTPVVQARIGRALLRRGGVHDTDARETVKDLAQEIFAELFKNDGKVLRRWDPRRGASLENFVGLLTERRVISWQRRSNGHTQVELSDEQLPADVSGAASPERRAASRELLECIVDGLRESLSPLGWTMFEMLFVWDGSVEDVSQELAMSQSAVRKWRSRLRKLARQWAEKCEKIGWEHG